MSRPPEISSAYARLVLQSGVAPVERLLQGVDLDVHTIATSEFIEARALAQLFRNYDSYLSDPAWTVRLGSQLSAGTHGPLGFAALSAPTLGDTMDVMGNLHAADRKSVV